MSNILVDPNASFSDSLKAINEVVQAPDNLSKMAIKTRSYTNKFKDFMNGLAVFAEKTQLQFSDNSPTVVSKIFAQSAIESYRKVGAGEDFVRDFKPLLSDKEKHINKLEEIVGEGQFIDRVRNFATFLEQELSKNIVHKSTLRS